MAIIGVGVDVVDIDRFVATLDRTPGLLDRLFTAAERKRSHASLAARFAAKEAIAKALGAPTGMGWHDAEIVTDEAGAPSFVIRDSVQARAEALGVHTVHVSMSHDAGIASAFVVLED
jgi:holo-[acyl-carrier protein] synthase